MVQASYSEHAQESLLHWPAVSASMAPELFSLYKHAMTSKEDRAAADRQRTEGRAAENTASEHGTLADAAGQATAAAAAADELAAAEAAEPEAALTGPADVDLDFGGPVDMEGIQEEPMTMDGPPQATLSQHSFGQGQKPAAMVCHKWHLGIIDAGSMSQHLLCTNDMCQKCCGPCIH